MTKVIAEYSENLHIGRIERALNGSWRLIGRALADVRRNPDNYLRAADRAIVRGDDELAAVCYRRAIDLSPRDPEPLRGLANLLAAKNDLDAAKIVYGRILEVEPDDRVTRFNLAVALSRTGELGQAQQEYLDLLAGDEDNIRARFNLAAVYQAQSKFSQARRQWTALLGERDALAPADASAAWRALGDIEMEVGNPRSAIQCYAEALDAGEPTAELYLLLAAAARDAGHHGQATVSVMRAGDIEPENAAVWEQAGDICIELHRQTDRRDMLQKALEFYRRSLDLKPDQDRLRRLLAHYDILAPATDQPSVGARTRPETNAKE